MSDKIVVMLALERGWENITALMEIRRFAPPKVPYLAEILTQNQDWRELLRLFDSPSSRLQNREFLAFLAQEIVLRGPDLTQTSARLLLEDLVASGHELSVLPLFQLPCEAGFAAWRRRYNNRGGSSWSWKPRPGRRKVTISQEGQRLETREIECDAARIGSAVANWCEESNGKIEALFRVCAVEGGRIWTQTLKNLGLESLRGADEMSLTRVDFSVALERHFLLLRATAALITTANTARGDAFEPGNRSRHYAAAQHKIQSRLLKSREVAPGSSSAHPTNGFIKWRGIWAWPVCAKRETRSPS